MVTGLRVIYVHGHACALTRLGVLDRLSGAVYSQESEL